MSDGPRRAVPFPRISLEELKRRVNSCPRCGAQLIVETTPGVGCDAWTREFRCPKGCDLRPRWEAFQ